MTLPSFHCSDSDEHQEHCSLGQSPHDRGLHTQVALHDKPVDHNQVENRGGDQDPDEAGHYIPVL